VQELLEPSAAKYGHLVLDEAQDLTPMQLRMVGRRIRSGSVTVLGDLAQATGLWKYPSWNDVMFHLGLEPTVPEELVHAYRVPSEIMELALRVLRFTAPSIEPPIAFRPGDREPDFARASLEERAGSAVDRAVAAHEEGGTVAVIGQPSVIDGVRAELERRGLTFGDGDRDELDITIELLDPVSAKGLEFDHVILVEPGVIVREASHGHGYRELYVALTRATRSLTVVHSEPLFWPFVDAESPAPLPAEPTEVTPRLDEANVTPTPSLGLSLDEALLVATRRGMRLDEALARALLALAIGGSEPDAAAALLEMNSSNDAVAALISEARSIASEDG
jgi:hypothetical protein